MPSGCFGQGVLDHHGVEAVLAASGVGTWDWDIVADRTKISLTTARLFGFSQAAIAEGPALADYLRAIHPDDRASFSQTVSDVRRSGGLFVAEYRPLPTPDQQRWALARGMFEVDETGAVRRARGIVIDVTETRKDGFGAGRVMFSAAQDTGGGIIRLADRALDAWRALQDLPAEDQEQLRPVLEQLLVRVGRRLAEVERLAEQAERRALILHS